MIQEFAGKKNQRINLMILLQSGHALTFKQSMEAIDFDNGFDAPSQFNCVQSCN